MAEAGRAFPLKCLLTGEPGVGKTTLVRAVVERLEGAPARGFYTEEKRGRRGRTGFDVVSLDGRRAALADHSAGSPRVGRYRVLLASFESVAIPALEHSEDASLLVIDEIGKMECFSERFVAAARRALASEVPVLATAAMHGGGFIAEAKLARGVELVRITRQNRDRLVEVLAEWVKSSGSPREFGAYLET